MRIFHGHRILYSDEVISGILSGGVKDKKEPANQSEVVKNIPDQRDNQASPKTFSSLLPQQPIPWSNPGSCPQQNQHFPDC